MYSFSTRQSFTHCIFSLNVKSKILPFPPMHRKKITRMAFNGFFPYRHFYILLLFLQHRRRRLLLGQIGQWKSKGMRLQLGHYSHQSCFLLSMGPWWLRPTYGWQVIILHCSKDNTVQTSVRESWMMGQVRFSIANYLWYIGN